MKTKTMLFFTALKVYLKPIPAHSNCCGSSLDFKYYQQRAGISTLDNSLGPVNEIQ